MSSKFVIQPTQLASRMPKGHNMCRCYFLFSGPLGDQLSQNVLDLSSPNFQDCRYHTYGWAWSIRPSLRDRSKDVAMVTDFWRESAKIGTPHLYSVRVCVSSVREGISRTTRVIFTNFFMNVVYSRGSVLLRLCDEIPRVRSSFGGFFLPH